MKASELRARLSHIPVEKCGNPKAHKSHTYRDFETIYCPGLKRKDANK